MASCTYCMPPCLRLMALNIAWNVARIGQTLAANGNCDEGIWLVCQKKAQKMKLAPSMTGSMNNSTLTTLVNLVPVSSTSRNFCASPPKSLSGIGAYQTSTYGYPDFMMETSLR